MSDWAPPLLLLTELQRRFERGPKREGAFAVWLVVRMALEVGRAELPADKQDRKRLVLLSQRLAPLAVPRSLARGLTTAMGHLEDLTPNGARVALAQLVAPARDALGTDAGEAIAQALLLLPARGVTRAGNR
ncbi:MAG: hypothetical protein ABIZ70_07500 [Gemmatimonadales bacterium]